MLLDARPLPVFRVADAEEQADFLASAFGHRRLWNVEAGEWLHWLEMTVPRGAGAVALAEMSFGLWAYGPV